MNKQQLASKIWTAANNLRKYIEADEYKDFILGFIFYKFLSEKVEKLFSDEDIEFYKNVEDKNFPDSIKESSKWNELSTKDKEDYEFISSVRGELGYFISYQNLFSTWISKGQTFNISDVRVALSAFNRNISKHKKLFENIFDTLENSLSNLGKTDADQSREALSIIQLINEIPMQKVQDYDMLGFIYEYLISMFAANAGKKAGEFYTPHEVSVLMSEIVASHLKDHNETVDIYDPTSGSGSLLITIGKSMSKYINPDKIKYFAQEIKKATYNLTRMNLIMRGILIDNIHTRNDDTLREDWPVSSDIDKSPLHVDAVVSNPPYSLEWDNVNKENDPRFAGYGVAPKSKADYAFLLHDLYHTKTSGIVTIVLPHGVLFRGNEEGKIRKQLIESNNIDAIIGLPNNIFYGTGIPTIIMVLRKNKQDDKVLFIDASKHFIKEATNNKLRASDIQRIVDVFTEKAIIPGFSNLVTRDEIRNNEYNLNIPRYVDSSDKKETSDLYSLLNGNVPNSELQKYQNLWNHFSTLKADLYEEINSNYSKPLIKDNIFEVILNNQQIQDYINQFKKSTEDLEDLIEKQIINKLKDNIDQIDLNKDKKDILDKLKNLLKEHNLIDYYDAFEILEKHWKVISTDVENIKLEGFESIKQVSPNWIYDSSKKMEIQKGFIGKVIPFELVQKLKMTDLLDQIKNLNLQIENIDTKAQEFYADIDEDSKEKYTSLFNEDFSKLDYKTVKKEIKNFEKVAEENPDSFESKVLEIYKNEENKKVLNKTLKTIIFDLENQTNKQYDSLSDSDALELIKDKWITPLITDLNQLPNNALENISNGLVKIQEKYEDTLFSIDQQIRQTQDELIDLLQDLNADEYDKKAIDDFIELLKK
ncbi:type I restriction-modification system subunit M [Mycoplasmopsis ciconiae]|uniref:site-specific DNA-methyltransferase (adenine-specific) n=1 Tax=Mycoplasmopsis ciconiae TaxID=561067 RepID=A0ABU7MLC6_9BACT|nr:type I restriction-modification system subunit M [Mycoplasmopsis ciconiae]